MMFRAAPIALAMLVACGDNDPGPAKPPSDILSKLKALPGVTVTESPTGNQGYHYYVLEFTQPVDHQDASAGTFQQEVSLLHRDEAAPLIIHTSGYFDYYLDRKVELTDLLDANQISIEHRFFGSSRPAPADWTKLTIEQMANDEHAIVTALRTIYEGAFISTGGSKGGMTAIYYRRFFPTDVDGTVPYVAPISFGAPDTRYDAFVPMLGPIPCHQAVQDLAVEMLAHRRLALENRTMDQGVQMNHQYTRIALGPAVESAIQSLEWSFWQYFGVDYCQSVPATTDSDNTLFSFLDNVSPPSDNDDEQVGLFEAYYYQAYFQLGYPDTATPYLTSLLHYTDADFDMAFPTGAPPAYDNMAAMMDVDGFVRNQGDRLLFIYGQWDPWTGGAFTLGSAANSLLLTQPRGTHGSRITHLTTDDEQAAFTRLQEWTGVTPVGTAKRVWLGETIRPHVPPAMLRVRGR
jgi:hypothetical protein